MQFLKISDKMALLSGAIFLCKLVMGNNNWGIIGVQYLRSGRGDKKRNVTNMFENPHLQKSIPNCQNERPAYKAKNGLHTVIPAVHTEKRSVQ
jgi:hypothetical protein